MSDRLTPRQVETVGLLCGGAVHKEAAAAMGVQPNAVKKYVMAARKQMGARTTPHLCALWVHVGGEVVGLTRQPRPCRSLAVRADDV